MEDLAELVWLIPALPLAGFLVLLVGGRRLGEPVAGWVATLACGSAFLSLTLGRVAPIVAPSPGRRRRGSIR